MGFPKLYQEKNPLEDENFIRDKKIELLHFADNLAYKLDPRVIDVSCSLMAEFEEIKSVRKLWDYFNSKGLKTYSFNTAPNTFEFK